MTIDPRADSDEQITPPSPLPYVSRSALRRVTGYLAPPTTCHYCQGDVELVSNSAIYGCNYGKWPYVYLCRACKAYVGLHPDTDLPLGTLADARTRKARKVNKDAFHDLLRATGWKRNEGYAWLAQRLGIPAGECHWGWFDADRAEQAGAICMGAAIFTKQLKEITMSEIVFYDTETTGLPDWKVPSDSEHQPHIVQLGAVVVDSETRDVIDTLDVIIKPDGWEITEESTEIHGITQEKAMAEGISETEAVDKLLSLCAGRYRNAFNRTFDQRILRIALKRYGYDEAVMDAWGSKDDHSCSMLMAKPVMKLLPKGKYGYKCPSLAAAYQFFTGEELQDAHTALADAKACMEVYFGVMDHQEAASADTEQEGR